MIALCVHETVAELGPPVVGSWYPPTAEYGLQRGSHYEVFGMGLFHNAVVALVLVNDDMPTWVPIGLLDLGVATPPSHWELQVYDGYGALGPPDGEHRWVFRWGYPELVRSDAHVDGLLEWEPDARRIFFEEVARRRQRNAED